MIIDAHCHVWPAHIAEQVLAARPAGLAARNDGTVEGLRRTMDEAGIDRGVCLAVASKAANLRRTNEFVGGVDRSRFIPFGSVHPEVSVEENLASLHESGLIGVKLHPLFQQLDLADPKVLEIARALAENGIVVITHAGAGGDGAGNQRGSSQRLRVLVDAVPDLRVIGCHFGGYHTLDAAEQHVVGSRAYLETSWPATLAELPTERVRAIIRRHGADRVIFGSDWPMAEPAAEIAAIRALGLGADGEAAILGGTLAGLLGLA